jgi:hypothetical protein
MKMEQEMKTHIFEISLIGHGENPEEAWFNIIEDLKGCLDYQKEDLVQIRNGETDEIEWEAKPDKKALLEKMHHKDLDLKMEDLMWLVYALHDNEIEALLEALHEDIGREASLFCEVCEEDKKQYTLVYTTKKQGE